MNEDDKAMAIALVRSHLLTGDQYMSYVAPYLKVRWCASRYMCVAEHVGGHYRRKAMCKRAIDSLACVCKQPELSRAMPEHPRPGKRVRGLLV